MLVCSVCTNKRCDKVPGDAHVDIDRNYEGGHHWESIFLYQTKSIPKDFRTRSSPVVPFVRDCVYNVPQAVMQSEDFHLAW